jgi:hypothetical protein
VTAGLLGPILMAGGCGGSATPVATLTGPASSPMPVTVAPDRQLPPPLPVATLTPIAAVSTGDTCPIADDSLCAAALEIRAAARANDVDYFVRRLSAASGDCTVGPSSCPRNQQGTPVGGVALFDYGSDCCYVSTEQFRDELARLLTRARPGASDGAGAGDWNLFGVLTGASFWRSKTGVVLTALFDDNLRWVIEIGVDRAGQQWKILGAINGAVSTYFKFPEAELHRW